MGRKTLTKAILDLIQRLDPIQKMHAYCFNPGKVIYEGLGPYFRRGEKEKKKNSLLYPRLATNHKLFQYLRNFKSSDFRGRGKGQRWNKTGQLKLSFLKIRKSLFVSLSFVFFYLFSLTRDNILWLRLEYFCTWALCWTANSKWKWSAIQIPLIDAISIVVGIIMEGQGPWGIRAWNSPTAAAFSGTLTLSFTWCLPETDAAHFKAGRGTLVVFWLNPPWITTATIGFSGNIIETVSPVRRAAPTGARVSCSLARIAPLTLPKAEAILCRVWNSISCFDSPLVCVASTSTTSIISKLWRPCPVWAATVTTARLWYSLILRAIISLSEANSETWMSPTL